MEPADPQDRLNADEDDEDEAGTSVTSWLSVCPRGLCKVQQKQSRESRLQTPSNSGRDTSCPSRYCPQLGSLCRVRVRLKANVDEAQTSVAEEPDEKLSIVDLTGATPAAFRRCHDSVLQVPLGEWTTLRLGDGQCDVVETCLETMSAGEKCEILLAAVGKGADEPGEDIPQRATVELHAFTPGKASWEMSPVEKWEWVKSHKEMGGVRFRSGDVWGAAHSYSQALRLLVTLTARVTEAEKHGHERDGRTDAAGEAQRLPSAQEFQTMKAELHSNMSLCQLKLKQPERAKDSAAKATELEPGAAKAWYRLGQASQMLGELEEAKRAFRKLLELQPEFPAALKALKDIAVREKETNAQLGLRLSKMFS